MRDYSRSQNLRCSAKQCFDALTLRIHAWWTERIEGEPHIEGGVFTVRFAKTFKRMQVVELRPGASVVWRCIASYLDLDTLAHKSQWDDTEIRWSIEPHGDGVTLSVTHLGLTPSIGCFEVCEKGWDHFFQNSLIPYLEQGVGRPHVEPLADEGTRRA